MKRHSLFLVVALLALSAVFPSCGWDDDREYEVRTRAAFLVAEDVNTGLHKVWRHEAGVLQEGYNRDLGVPDGSFSGLQYRDGELWMGNSSSQEILRIDPSNDEIVERISGLPLQPHSFSVGERYILLGDTVNNQIAFVRIRNGEAYVVDVPADPGQIWHNNRMFFLQLGDSSIYVYDEWALTTRYEHTLNDRIVETQFNQLLNFYISLVDSSGEDLFALVSGTDGSLAVERDNVNYQKIRFSPYLDDRFGTEWTFDLRLDGTQLSSGTLIFPDSLNNFEADFFESRLYYQWNDSLFQYDLNTQSRQDSFPFPDNLVSSVYWVGGE